MRKSRKKGESARVRATREEGVITSRDKGMYWMRIGDGPERPYAPGELESVRKRKPVKSLATAQQHEFVMSAVKEYCAVCTLPRGNAIHEHTIEKTIEQVQKEKYGG